MRLDKFVPDLVRRIGELYDPAGAHSAACSVAALALPGKRAAILGQIVVELVMNVYRHALEGRSGGKITVDLALVDQADAMLVIADDGPGLREPDRKRKHFGFTIVAGLAKGLGGSFDYESRDGLITRVLFPVGDSPDLG